MYIEGEERDVEKREDEGEYYVYIHYEADFKDDEEEGQDEFSHNLDNFTFHTGGAGSVPIVQQPHSLHEQQLFFI